MEDVVTLFIFVGVCAYIINDIYNLFDKARQVDKNGRERGLVRATLRQTGKHALIVAALFFFVLFIAG